MIVPMEHLFRAVEPWLPSCLIPRAARTMVRALAERLPPIFSWGTLECRLLPPDERVDLSVCALGREGAREAFSAAMDQGVDLSALRAARRVLEPWARGRDPITEMPQIWLEYDLPEDEDRSPLLFSFMDLHDWRSGPRPPAHPTELLRFARDTLTRASGDPLNPELFATYERCLRLFPPGGRVISAALLSPRGLDELRLDASVPYAEIRPWLRAIGWPGDARRLDALFDLLGPGFSRSSVQLDLGAAVQPSIGFLYHPPSSPDEGSSWRPLVTRLVELGLCDPERGRAAIGFIGEHDAEIPGAAWSVKIHRELGFKLALRREGTIEVKAYLSFHARYALI